MDNETTTTTTIATPIELDVRCRGYLYHDAYDRPPATEYRRATRTTHDTTTGAIAAVVERIAVCRECATAIDRDRAAA